MTSASSTEVVESTATNNFGWFMNRLQLLDFVQDFPGILVREGPWKGFQSEGFRFKYSTNERAFLFYFASLRPSYRKHFYCEYKRQVIQ